MNKPWPPSFPSVSWPEALHATIKDLRDAVNDLDETAEGDSNDAEIAAGRDVADIAMILAGQIERFLGES